MDAHLLILTYYSFNLFTNFIYYYITITPKIIINLIYDWWNLTMIGMLYEPSAITP